MTDGYEVGFAEGDGPPEPSEKPFDFGWILNDYYRLMVEWDEALKRRDAIDKASKPGEWEWADWQRLLAWDRLQSYKQEMVNGLVRVLNWLSEDERFRVSRALVENTVYDVTEQATKELRSRVFALEEKVRRLTG